MFDGPSRRFLAPYYLVHAAIPLVYLTFRLFIWPQEKLGWLQKSQGFLGIAVFAREFEVFLLLMLVVLSRFRRSPTWDHFLVSLALFVKTYVAVMLWNVDRAYLAWYGIFVTVVFIVLRRPRYYGPTKVRKLDVSNFKQVIIDGPRTRHLARNSVSSADSDSSRGGGGKASSKSTKKTRKGKATAGDSENSAWLVEVTAGWHTSSTLFAPMFAELSLRFSTEELKFGTIDVAKRGNAEIAASFNVNTGVRSKQLPTYILFENGEEVERLPPIDKKTKEPIATDIRKEGLIQFFSLDRKLLDFRKRKYAHT